MAAISQTTVKISLTFVPKVQINNISAMVQIKVSRRPGDKPLYEPMMVNLPTHICVTRPQWANIRVLRYFCVLVGRLELCPLIDENVINSVHWNVKTSYLTLWSALCLLMPQLRQVWGHLQVNNSYIRAPYGWHEYGIQGLYLWSTEVTQLTVAKHISQTWHIW